MKDGKPLRDLDDVVQDHLDACRFEEAEAAVREMIARIERDDHLRLWLEYIAEPIRTHPELGVKATSRAAVRGSCHLESATV
jgi:hypothetical protein